MQAREDPVPTAEAVLSAHKRQLREEAGARRAKLARALPDYALRIAAFDLGLPQGVAVGFYWPMRDEADPRALAAALAAKGHPLALPRILKRDAPLAFHRWDEGDAMRTNAFGVTEPLSGAEPANPSVLLVPLLAFDADGYRLGYGGGYYDRTLASLRAAGNIFAIGVAFSGQEVPQLPRAPHDQRLHGVVSETGVRRFKA